MSLRLLQRAAILLLNSPMRLPLPLASIIAERRRRPSFNSARPPLLSPVRKAREACFSLASSVRSRRRSFALRHSRAAAFVFHGITPPLPSSSRPGTGAESIDAIAVGLGLHFSSVRPSLLHLYLGNNSHLLFLPFRSTAAACRVVSTLPAASCLLLHLNRLTPQSQYSCLTRSLNPKTQFLSHLTQSTLLYLTSLC